MIKVVIFDLGGVVVSSEVEKIPNYIADYLKLEYIFFYKFFKNYKSDLTIGKISLIDVYSEAIKHFKVKNLNAQDIVDEHLQIFQRIIEHLNEEVLALITKLREHYLVVCLVNAEIDVVPLVRRRGIYNYFQHAYISTEMGMEKPDPRIFITVLNDLGCEAKETVFIDDKEPNVESARNLAIHAILYKNNRRLIGDLAKLKLNF